jgi:hypothetical protein
MTSPHQWPFVSGYSPASSKAQCTTVATPMSCHPASHGNPPPARGPPRFDVSSRTRFFCLFRTGPHLQPLTMRRDSDPTLRFRLPPHVYETTMLNHWFNSRCNHSTLLGVVVVVVLGIVATAIAQSLATAVSSFERTARFTGATLK